MGVVASLWCRDTVGTFEMAVELDKASLVTCIHKHYSVEEVRQAWGWLSVAVLCVRSEA